MSERRKKTLKEYIDLLFSQGLIDRMTVLDESLLDQKIEYISYNSLDVKPGTLFICKGLNFRDEYLSDAIARGAVAYLGEKEFDN
ncbi:MAG: UDP-N-acetylmuramoyl-L-alanyl-D-glutamate--2,6-diaminopimelate ligase, partial [Firmicutes bacterium]|nr:UDP-N-acetylmuramoyl-L-alanyl-D-glutamate--2,6-diaminopimelate ligase [Bacillota bacterium]